MSALLLRINHSCAPTAVWSSVEGQPLSKVFCIYHIKSSWNKFAMAYKIETTGIVKVTPPSSSSSSTHMHISKQFSYVVFIVALFQEVRAVRDLQEGDEITANYVDRCNFTSKDLSFYVNFNKKTKICKADTMCSSAIHVPISSMLQSQK